MGMSVLLVICINYRTDILYEFSVSFPFFFFWLYLPDHAIEKENGVCCLEKNTRN